MAKVAAAAPKLPKTMGQCVDRLYEIKLRKSTLTAEINQLDEEAKLIKEHIIKTVPKDDSTGAMGKVARATVVVKKVPHIVDFDKVKSYLKKTGNYNIIQRRLSETAVLELWDAGKEIPGVEPFTYATVSLNKL